VLVASVNYSTDTVTSLKGTNTTEYLTLYYLLTDHDRKEHDSGSTTQVVNADGTTKAQQLYKAFGEKRFPCGLSDFS
jgi:hypothetical protein